MTQSSAIQYQPLISVDAADDLEAWLASATAADGRRHLVLLGRVPHAISTQRSVLRAAFREAQRAGALDQHGLATAVDVVERDDGFYVVSQFARGEGLDFIWRSYVDQNQPVPLALTARVIAEAAAALDNARRQTGRSGEPLIHGHLSPSSLVVGYDGKSTLAGYGTARLYRAVADARGGGATNVGYAAPEQFRGEAVDSRTDIFGLGVVLWEMLAGRRLFERAGPYEVMRAICEESVAKPSSISDAVPSRIDPIVGRMLAKDPARRYDNYRALLGGLEEILQLPGVADQSMRLGQILADRFERRADIWHDLSRAERAGDLQEAADLFAALNTRAGPPQPESAPAPETISSILAATPDDEATDPMRDSLGDKADLRSRLGLGAKEPNESPDDTIRTEIPDEIWDEAGVDHSDVETAERDVTVVDGPAESASADIQESADDRPSQSSRTTTEMGMPLGALANADAPNADGPADAPHIDDPQFRAPSDNPGTDNSLFDSPPSDGSPQNRPQFDQSHPVEPRPDESSSTPTSANQPPPAGVEVDPPADPGGPATSRSTNSGSTNSGSTNSGPTNSGPTNSGPTNLGAGFDDMDWSAAFRQFDDADNPEDYETPLDVETILESGRTRLPSRDDRDGKCVMEIVRFVAGQAFDSTTLDGFLSRYRDPDAPFRAKIRRGVGHLDIAPDAQVDGWLRRRNDTDPHPPLPDQTDITLKVGDQCELRRGEVRYRIRVFRPPLSPRHNRPQVTRKTLSVFGIALGVALLVHVGALLGVLAVDALGVRLTVTEKPDQEEIFAEGKLKKPDKPDEPDKPKPPKPLPRPKPKPADPTEQKAKIPKTIKKKLAKQVDKKLKSRSTDPEATDTQKTLEMLKTPNPGDGKTVKDTVTNIDAVKKPGASSGGFKVGGTIAKLKGNKVNMATGGGGKLGKLAGKKVGKEVGKLDKRKKSGKVRGKVRGIKALTKVHGSLSRSEVYKTISRYQGKILGCYERRLMAKPSLNGKIVFTWTVKTNGRVRSIRQRSSTLGDPKVSNCVSGILKSIKFPRPKGGEVEISYPFMFQQR